MADLHRAIGLVAIGRNEGERLKRCLRSIPDAIVVVYVDSASTDDSISFARSMNASVIELDMALPFSAARARNEGVNALLEINPDVQFVQFVDGDCELEDGWLAAAFAFLESNDSVAAVCGRRKERYRDASFYNRMCDDEWNTPIGKAAACGGDAMIRIKAFLEVQGYDASMIAGEEPELCQRMRGAGWQIWRLDAPMTIHDADMHHLSQWWKRAVRSGFGYAQVYRKTASGRNEPLYGREVASALFWTFGVAGFALLCGLSFGPIWLVIGPVIWTAQLLRLTRRDGLSRALHLMIGKMAETWGIIRFAISIIRGRRQSAIFYK
ncbi:MAG: glycosyltransferase [Sphingorhabdus sp.]